MDSPPENEQIETYLDRLCVWLMLLPDAEEAREEVRQHLLLIADGERERGTTPAEAVAVALDKMGDADALGERLYQARLQKMQQQFGQWMPSVIQTRYRLCASLGTAWGVVFALAMLWPVFRPGYAFWPTWLGIGTVIGIGYGALFSWFVAYLPKRSPETVTDYAGILPLLSEGASPRGKRHYVRLARFIRSANRTRRDIPSLLRFLLPNQVGLVALFVCVTQGSNLLLTRHLAPNAMGNAIALVTCFVFQNLTAWAVSRSLKRSPS